MMLLRLIKGGIWGLLVGLAFAFISYYLIINKNDYIFILLFGFRGFIFGICFILLNELVKNIFKKTKNINQLIIGAICGFFAIVFDLSITYSNIPDLSESAKINIIIQLIRYSVGFLILGASVGFFINQCSAHNKDN